MKFGKFEIGEVLGQGGFGRVFLAYDPTLKRQVAIKTCTLTDSGIRKRFLREAEIAAGLRHSFIGVIYDLGEQDGEPYIVQEYLPGEDLEDIIRRHDDVPLAVKLRMLSQVAQALSFAHNKGVIHRDIKPRNIRVLTNGDIRVLDFGIAKRSFEDTGTALTQTGVGMGTVGYISPEQLRGEQIDHRTDIFSYGAMAFELLTCQKPFDGESLPSVFYKILNDQPVWPAQLPQHFPAPLRELVDRCLAKEAARRPQSCEEIVRALAAVPLPADDDATRAYVPPPPAATVTRALPATAPAPLPARPIARRRTTPVIAVAGVAALGTFGWLAASRFGAAERDVAAAAADSIAPPPMATAPPGAAAAVTTDTTPAAPVRKTPPRPAAFVQLTPDASARAAAIDTEPLLRALRAAGYDASFLTVRGRVAVSDVIDSNEFGMASALATVTLQAARASDGAQLARSSVAVPGAGTSGSMAVNNAIARAIERAASDLVSRLPPR